MRSRKVIFSLCIILVMTFTGCTTTVIKPADVVVGSEDAAIAKLGNDVHSLLFLMLNKKIGILYFTTLDWQVIGVGKRLSDRLAGYLNKKGGLTLIPRARLDVIMKTEAIEQASIFDIDAVKKKGKALTMDVVIMGTVVQSEGTIEIELKVMEVATGRLMLVSGVRMPATREFVTPENPEIILLNKKSPDKIMAMNRAYFLLQWMKTNQPLVFLLAVVKNDEMKSLRTTNPVLSEKLAKRKERYQQERPDVIKKIRSLQDGLTLMERYEPQRFSEIIRWKKELVDRMR